jgi:regulator of sirC expression with transglutaminase-like and TPR domain
VLHQAADELRRRADLVEQLARYVHVAGVCRELEQVVTLRKDADISLIDAALAISRLDNEYLDPAVYRQEIERMADEIRQGLPAGADESTRRAALDRYLFELNGFHGSRSEYYHQANSYLDRVIDDREGLPITLSVLYIELAKRIDLVMEGVGLPGHFIVRWMPAKGDPVLIDPFHQGKVISRDEARALVLRTAGQELQDEHLRPAQNRQILVRILQNLLGAAQQRRDGRAILGYLDAILTIDPESHDFRVMRAMLLYELRQADKAIADLDWIIEHDHGGINLDRIQSLRQRFQESRR